MSSGFEVPNAPWDFDQFQAVDAVVLLRSLIRHLFVRFEMPQYWVSVWFQEGEIDYAQMEWFVHVASGQSLRKARGLPLVFSKQATHEVGQAPGGLTLFEAMRWGQLRAMGAGRELFRQILHTPAAGDFNNDASLRLPLDDSRCGVSRTSGGSSCRVCRPETIGPTKWRVVSISA